MVIEALRTLDEILKDLTLSFRDKLFHIYIRYTHEENNDTQNKYSKELLKIIKQEDNIKIYNDIYNFCESYDFPEIERIKSNLQLVLKQFKNKIIDTKREFNQLLDYYNLINEIYLEEKLHINAANYKGKSSSKIELNNLNELNGHILNKNDFLEYACKSQFGGMQEGGIYISKKDGKLYFLKTYRAGDTTLVDEYFLNNTSKIIIPKYISYETHLVDNGQTAISYVPHSYDFLNKIMKLGGGNTNFENKEKSLEVVRKGIKKYFKEELKDKKIYGLISSIIMMALNYNLDGNPGNLMIRVSDNKLQFFTIDPMQWSMDNKFKLDINIFIDLVNFNFGKFKNEISRNKCFKQSLTEFLQKLLEIQHNNFIGCILENQKKNNPLFMESEIAKNSNFIKDEITRALIYQLPKLIGKLTDEEIQQELEPFLNINYKKLNSLFNSCYVDNESIGNLFNNSRENKIKEVQKEIFEKSLRNMKLLSEALTIIYEPQINIFKSGEELINITNIDFSNNDNLKLSSIISSNMIFDQNTMLNPKIAQEFQEAS